jgi:hypothetical protein
MKDGKCLTAADKEKLANDFNRFFRSGFNRIYFNAALYLYLYKQFGFLPQCDEEAFYKNRFADPTGRIKTLKTIVNAPNSIFDEKINSCADLNAAIKNIAEKTIYSGAKIAEARRAV